MLEDISQMQEVNRYMKKTVVGYHSDLLILRLRRIAAVVVALTIALAACTQPDNADSDAAQSPNVLIISFDTLRADHLSTYGYRRPTSPALDALADKSVVFDRAYTVMPTTLPTHLSMMTGVAPLHHQVYSNNMRFVGDTPTLAEQLSAEGYRTAGFVSGLPLRKSTGMDRGFDEYPAIATRKVEGEITTERAINWLHENTDDPFFMFVHFFDAHIYYSKPDNHEFPFAVDGNLKAWMDGAGIADISAEELDLGMPPFEGKQLDLFENVNLYDNQIHRVDGLIGNLLSALKQSGQFDNTLIIVTSDHGQGLGQHDHYYHGLRLFEEQVRVALIVKPTQQMNWPSTRNNKLVSILDISPLVLEITGTEAGPVQHGRSLNSAVFASPETGERNLLVHRRSGKKLVPPQNQGKVNGQAKALPQFAVLTENGYKFIEADDGSATLYYLPDDPLELANLAPEETKKTQELKRIMEQLKTSQLSLKTPVYDSLDERTRRALESLGYIE
jgi:arylsulfatase A-like enzyme